MGVSHKIPVGTRFGRLVVLTDEIKSDGSYRQLCRCDCGNTKLIRKYELGRSVNSCGCLKIEKVSKLKASHGMSGTQLYFIVADIIQRCRNPSHTRYKDYGGRGVSVDERWDTIEKLLAGVLLEIGPRPSSSHSIDRIDNTLGYCPGNIQWATRLQQANNKRNNRRVSFNGETHTIAEWARKLKVPASRLYARVSRHGDEAIVPSIKSIEN